MHEQMHVNACRGQKTMLDVLELDLQVIVIPPMCVLGTEASLIQEQQPQATRNSLSCRTISPAPSTKLYSIQANLCIFLGPELGNKMSSSL